jgi:hypothetical protein
MRIHNFLRFPERAKNDQAAWHKKVSTWTTQQVTEISYNQEQHQDANDKNNVRKRKLETWMQ